MRFIFYFFWVTILYSCASWPMEDDLTEYGFTDKKFIDKIMEEPDNIITIIDSSRYYHKQFREGLLKDTILKSYIPYIKSLRKNGYTYVYVESFIVEQSYEGVTCLKDVKLKSKQEELYLNFVFETIDCQWKLERLNIDKMTWLERAKYYENLPDHILE